MLFRNDDQLFAANTVPRIPTFDLEFARFQGPLRFHHGGQAQSLSWLPSSKGHFVFAVATSPDPSAAADISRNVCCGCVQSIFYLEGSDTSYVLKELDARLPAVSWEEGMALVAAILDPQEHTIEILTTGNCQLLSYSCRNGKIHVQGTEETESGTLRSRMLLEPGDLLALLPLGEQEAIPVGEQSIEQLAAIISEDDDGQLPHVIARINQLLQDESRQELLAAASPLGLDSMGLVMRRKRHASLPQILGSLTTREKETLDMIMSGKTVKEMATIMNVSIQTVSKHRANLWEKMGVSSDVRLVLRMLSSPS